MSKKILLCFLCLICALLIPGLNFAAEEEFGTVGISLSSLDGLEKYKETNPNDGDGVFVYISNIDTQEIYRFPLSKANNYAGRFDIPYGNYRVIKNPDASSDQCVIGCDTVFTVGKTNPDASIQCFIESPDDTSSSVSSETIATASPNTAAPTASPAPQEDGGFHLSFQNIITIIILVVFFGLWIYKRFIKYRA